MYILDVSSLRVGLCNYLFVIWNSLVTTRNKSDTVYVKGFKKDMFTQTSGCMSELFDMSQTNINLRSKGYPLLGDIQSTTNMNINIFKQVVPTMFPLDATAELINCFVLNPHLENIKNSIKPKTNYSVIHFKLEVDSVIHYLSKFYRNGHDVYSNYIRITDTEASIRASYGMINTHKYGKIWLEMMVDQYKNLIDQNGRDKHYYICSSIYKDPRHKYCEKYMDQLLDYLPNKTFIKSGETTSPHREISALIELYVIKEAESFIGFEGSTFSSVGHLLMNSNNTDATSSFTSCDKLDEQLRSL